MCGGRYLLIGLPSLACCAPGPRGGPLRRPAFPLLPLPKSSLRERVPNIEPLRPHQCKR